MTLAVSYLEELIRAFFADGAKWGLRIGYVASEVVRHRGVAICAAISPFRDARGGCRALMGDAFIEVFVDTDLATCESRDSKGLYAKARAGEIKGFTGIDDPYEPPQSPEIYVDTMVQTPDESLQLILDKLEDMGYIEHAERLVRGQRPHSGYTDLAHGKSEALEPNGQAQEEPTTTP